MLAEAAGSVSGRGCCSSLIRLFGRCMHQQLGTVAACLGVACSSSSGQLRGSVSLRPAAGVARDADGCRFNAEGRRNQLQVVAAGATPEACWGRWVQQQPGTVAAGAA